MSPHLDAVVIGAGQAGLATAYHLQRQHLNFVVLEAGPRPAGSWPTHYRSLRLFSPARHASLPGLPFPGSRDHFPSRDEVSAYLEAYAARFDFPLRTGVEVVQVSKSGEVFTVTIRSGQTLSAHSVIVPSGAFRRPFVPQLEGQAGFQGRRLHSCDYQTPEPFAAQDVVVVGAGNSAVQIAAELASQARVSLATRRPVRFMPQRLLGHDLHDWLSWSGLDQLPLGRWGRVPEVSRILDAGPYRAALKVGRPQQRRMFTAFTANGVEWPDGRREAVDAVIFATGFRPNLDFLAGTGALGEGGQAIQRSGVSLTVPGLYYVGLPGQRAIASATLRGAGRDAEVVVRHLRRVKAVKPRWPERWKPALPACCQT